MCTVDVVTWAMQKSDVGVYYKEAADPTWDGGGSGSGLAAMLAGSWGEAAEEGFAVGSLAAGVEVTVGVRETMYKATKAYLQVSTKAHTSLPEGGRLLLQNFLPASPGDGKKTKLTQPLL